MSVDLPAPLAPTRPVTPSPTVRSRWSSAVTPGYALVRPAVSMTPTRPTYPGDVSTAASSAEERSGADEQHDDSTSAGGLVASCCGKRARPLVPCCDEHTGSALRL